MGKEEQYEFQGVTLLSPFAVGIPGKRTFFLGIGDKNEWVRIWVEKEHLLALAEGIDQLFLLLSQKRINFSDEVEAPSSPDDTPLGLPTAELDIVQLTLGYDEPGKATIIIAVQPAGAQESNPAIVNCEATIAQIKKLLHQTKNIIAAGRPLCPLCGGPIDPTGHVCPAQN
jgi:uncharacterized repeat protein (TIGR03847 family)